MELSKQELIDQLDEIKQKYTALETKYAEETDSYKNTVEDLKYKLMFLEGIANSAIDGFLVVNPFGQKILQNKRTIDLWKIPEEIVNDPDGLKQVHHVMGMTVNPQQFVQEIINLKEHPDEKSRDELELVDGTVLDRYSSPVIGPDGKNYGRIWTFHDITERKKIEKQLVQLNRDKDKFISILAHDLRNPFTTIEGLSELLTKDYQNYTIDQINEMINIIYDSVKKTRILLEDTLQWENTKSYKNTFVPSVVKLCGVINEVIEILKPSANLKKIKTNYTCAEDMQVNSDIYMLKAILRNLLSNSIKFTNPDGEIIISANQEGSVTTVSVADNGIGIEPEFLANLFDLSSIHSTKGTANETGTGLGLLLCKEFVEKHNGKIWIDSIVNKGTKVSFTLPG
ncbi:MAG: hypothetical protein GXX85_10000 [Ignavibacteria bacterium]|nr:hypothetical protein [Ignavibacteria bacterium]